MNMDTKALKLRRYVDLLSAAEIAALPEMASDSPMTFAPSEVPVHRVISREVHEAEKRDLWSKVWQFACREDHLRNVGDQYVYDICDKSYLIVRSAPDKIRAFVNACLHRGRALRDFSGSAPSITCPFHSFAWNLDGSLRSIPCRKEMEGRSLEEWALPEVSVDTWDGFVFINPDPNAASLESFLGEMPAHFQRWGLKDRALTKHVAMKIRCNWKIAQEAFMEAFHVSTTHPQSLLSVPGEASKYDVYGNFSRGITPSFRPNDRVRECSEQEVADSFMERLLDDEAVMVVPDGSTARDAFAGMQRARLRGAIGDKTEEVFDTELIDLFFYTLYPNFHPWGGFNEICYRFRPNGDDHRTSLMEVLILSPVEDPASQPPVPVELVDFDESPADVPNFGGIGRFLEQDLVNLPAVQKGLEATSKKTVTFSAYQEMKIRHFYALHDKWVS
jgi:phenylpropionate dioxygenase-like ring-hydroxylating dioxygenase large terminal subunit